MPTLTEVELVVSDLFRVVDQFDKYCNTNSEKFCGASSQESDFLSHLKPADGIPFNTQSLMVSALESFRGGLSSQYAVSRSLITTGLRTWADHASIPETSPEAILDRLFTYFTENSYTIQSRGMTLGTPAADGGNDGGGIINRLKVDENSMQIESGHTDAKRADCISDQSSGTEKHEELFELRGADRLRDQLVVVGSGLTKNIRALSARNSLHYASNPSFESYSGTTAVPTAITGWSGYSVDELGQFAISTTTYRDYPGAPATHYSLEFTSATGITGFELNQDLKERNISISRGVPLYVQVAVQKPDSGGSGTVSVDLGASTASTVNVSALATGWNVLRMATGVTAGGDVDNWYMQMKDNVDLNLSITVSATDVGRVLRFDDIVIAPFTEFDGGWYAIVGAANKFSLGDKFTWADTATEAIIQKWIARLFPGYYLPHAASTPTWPEPT